MHWLVETDNRLPESVAHVAEALWMQALDEGRRRAAQEQHSSERALAADQQSLEVRSHVLSLREGELESRIHAREVQIAALEAQVRDLTVLLRKEHATRDSLTKRIAELEQLGLARRRSQKRSSSARPRPKKQKATARRAATPRRPPARQGRKKSVAEKRRR